VHYASPMGINTIKMDIAKNTKAKKNKYSLLSDKKLSKFLIIKLNTSFFE
jgi:hypothetical protein